jgi:hypothetical protein
MSLYSSTLNTARDLNQEVICCPETTCSWTKFSHDK